MGDVIRWERHAVWAGAVLVRVGILIFGAWQDAHLEVPFTDVDYYVYADAARHVLNGESPFMRHTYRYTPLLAYIMLPCHLVTFSFGKVLFAIMDLVLGALIERTLLFRGVSPRAALWSAATWLWNPMSFTVSTRGNADVLICTMVVATIYLFVKRHLVLGSIMFGLAVHFKIYPLVYAASLLIFLDERYTRKGRSVLNRARFGMFVISASVFLGLLGLFYWMYGWEFVYETYLYHFVRRDNRHNFSPYFYALYLGFAYPSSMFSGLMAFLPQMLPVAVAAYCLGRDLPFAFFVQTVLFVAFNKVSTAQYFIWYWSLVPLILPYSRASWKRGLFLVAAWFAGELHWLYWAFQLEMVARPVFTMVWLACLAFFAVNCMILMNIIQLHRHTPCFDTSGNVAQLTPSKQ
ncbi:GPI mannosyltransferase 1 [Plasmodiophora brassicae]